ncbi:hypothetical protein H6783_01155 [Candidatus Nomurabacteria bacterium]|nr:hypothetical protein [Candidatus Nomurabacteria bacterium]
MIMGAQKRILLAVVFAVCVIGGSWWLSLHSQNDTLGELNAGSGDSSNVTLPDDLDLSTLINTNWREHLATANLATSSSNSAPETITDRYAVTLLERIMNSHMNGATEAPVSDIVQQSLSELEQAVADVPFTNTDVQVTKDISQASLKRYGNAIMQITLNHPSPYETAGDELDILTKADASGNADDLLPLQDHVDYMNNIIRDTAALEVPIIYLGDQLAILNAYQAHLNDLRAMQSVFNDPLLTIARLRYYEENNAAIYNAYTNLYNRMYLNGVRWNISDVASQFVETRE